MALIILFTAKESDSHQINENCSMASQYYSEIP